jgi:methylmalonyl-CoA/ethylmalonyl-CoA epimerase
MNKNGLGTHIVTQIGIVVKDIEKTSEAFSRILGLPKPPISITGGESARAVNRGKPTTAQAKLAFFNLGQVAIELIEPMGGDSVWQEVLDEKGEGVHHIAFNVKGTDQVTNYLAEHDIPVSQQGHYPGGMYTYVESESQIKVMIELLENFG